MANDILRRLKFSGAMVEAVTELIYHHDDRIKADARDLKRRLGNLGERRLRLLIDVQRADARAHSPYMRAERLAEIDTAAAMLDAIIARRPCVTLRGLAVNGDDLIAAGARQGPEIGAALRSLLELVVDDELPNEKGALLSKASEILGAPGT
jgi:tRNA nucleotidyltransferase (CCA-adding enzyme)